MKQRVGYQPRPLSEFPEVMTLQDICAVIGKHPKFGERLRALQNKSGVRCLPEEIPGIRYRYSKEAVARWIRQGVPQVALKHAKAA